MRPLHTGVLLILLSGPLFAQDERPGVVWGSAYASMGVFADHRTDLFPGDIGRLASGSVLLSRDMSDHRFQQAMPSPGGVFSAAASFHPLRGQEREGPELRLGMLATSQQAINALYERSVHIPYDTLTSNQTGAQYLVDSVVTSTYELAYRYNMAGVHGAMIWRTKRRFSFHAGIGASVGVVYGANTVVQHWTVSTLQSAGITGPVHEMEDVGPDQEEAFAHGAGYWWQWHIPLGIGYRLHRDHDLWGRMHLYYEIVPQMLFVQRPALRYTSGIGLQTHFGLRLQL